MSDIVRNLMETVTYLASRFPIVALLGARQVGKSTILAALGSETRVFDMEHGPDLDRVQGDPALFFRTAEGPIFLDEAQLAPELFPEIRVYVDRNRDQPGQVFITGSSSPALVRSINETLAGRIAIVEVEPLSWNERSRLSKSLFVEGGLAAGDFSSLEPRFDRRTLLDACLHGGMPEPYLGRGDPRFFALWMENYIRTYVDRDVRALFPNLSLDRYRRFVRMLGSSSGELLNAAQLARSLDVSQPTARSYIEIASGTFFWRQLRIYDKNTKKRLVRTPRGHVRDSGLLCHLLGIRTVDDLLGHQLFGRIWESFVIEEIIRQFTEAAEVAQFSFYRTHNQAEIDLIIESRFGLIPVEVKAGLSADRRSWHTLHTFAEDHDCPYALLINTQDEIARLSEKVIQVPAFYL